MHPETEAARVLTAGNIERLIDTYGVEHPLAMADEQISHARALAAEYALTATITAAAQTETRAACVEASRKAEGRAIAWEDFAAEYAGAGLA